MKTTDMLKPRISRWGLLLTAKVGGSFSDEEKNLLSNVLGAHETPEGPRIYGLLSDAEGKIESFRWKLSKADERWFRKAPTLSARSRAQWESLPVGESY